MFYKLSFLLKFERDDRRLRNKLDVSLMFDKFSVYDKFMFFVSEKNLFRLFKFELFGINNKFLVDFILEVA